MRTFATCLFAAVALWSTSGSAAQPATADHPHQPAVTVVHELVVAPMAPATHHVNRPTLRRVVAHPMLSRARRARPVRARSERPSWLGRFGRAMGITVRHR